MNFGASGSLDAAGEHGVAMQIDLIIGAFRQQLGHISSPISVNAAVSP